MLWLSVIDRQHREATRPVKAKWPYKPNCLCVCVVNFTDPLAYVCVRWTYSTINSDEWGCLGIVQNGNLMNDGSHSVHFLTAFCPTGSQVGSKMHRMHGSVVLIWMYMYLVMPPPSPIVPSQPTNPMQWRTSCQSKHFQPGYVCWQQVISSHCWSVGSRGGVA